MELQHNQIDLIIKKYNKSKIYPMEKETFLEHAQRYIEAIKEHRMICSIGSVSRSGMSRTIKFLEMSKGESRYNLLNFYQFFEALGYSKAKENGYFKISGCGMDMIFNTNYTIMHQLKNMGFIDKDECSKLAQATPSVV
jgi:hypothetical protein